MNLLFKRNAAKLTDEQLLAEYKRSGDSEYFGMLYDRYTPLLYGVCLKYLNNTERAEDAVMELFEQLLPKVCQYEIGVFRTWLHTVVKNHCLQILRKESREIRADYDIDRMESDDIMYLLDEEEADSERLEIMKHCLEKLPEEQKRSITLFFMDDMSYADIVDSTGYTLSRVKSYIQNGKRNLKICMERQLT